MSRRGQGSRAEVQALRYLSQWYQLECRGNDPGRPVTDQPTQMTMDSTHRLVPLPDARIVRTLRDDAPLPAGTRWVEVKYLQRYGQCHRLHPRAVDSVRYLQDLALVCQAEGMPGLWCLSVQSLPAAHQGWVTVRLHRHAARVLAREAA